MKKIDLAEPFQASIGKDKVTITAVEINYPSAEGYLSIVQAARELIQEGVNPQATLQTERIRQQCKFLDASNKPHSFDYVQIHNLPIKVAKLIIPGLHQPLHEEGKILIAGDGIQKAIHISLGHPLSTGGDPIKELEFHASTYGEIEQVLVEDPGLEQTLVFIKTIGKPPGLQVLPSWAISDLTLQDLYFVQEKVLPSFLG